MNERIGISILAIVGIMALASLVLVYKNATTLAMYEQPAGNKPIYLQTSRFLPNFDMCQQYLCVYPSTDVFFGETEPAATVGTDTLTGNIRCGCPDGHEFQIRPDRIEEGTYP